MRKTDYEKIAIALARYDFDNKTNTHNAINVIFSELHKTDQEQGDNFAVMMNRPTKRHCNVLMANMNEKRSSTKY